MTQQRIRYGAVLPGGTATEQLYQAVLAEQAGWDGVFTWEAAYGVDPWSVLAAAAPPTTRVRLGTMLTPLPWRRPWKVASQVATLDQLSGGRAILAAGVGATSTDLPDTGEVTGIRERADLMDEGIDLIRALWRGEREHHGEHYRYRTGRMDLAAAVQPVQERIPVWVVGVWPRPRSMRRVLRCDGFIPQFSGGTGDTGGTGGPAGVREALGWLSAHGAGPGMDVVIDGETPAGDPAAAAGLVAPWAQAGVTWWLETRWGSPDDLAGRLRQMRERLAAGPPREG